MKEAAPVSTTVIVLAGESTANALMPALAKVGTLPAALRIVLSLRSAGIPRTVLCMKSEHAPRIAAELQKTRRVPKTLEHYEYAGQPDLAAVVRHVAESGKVVFISGDRCYQPSLLKKATDWSDPDGALAFSAGDELIGIFALSSSAAAELAASGASITSLHDLQQWAQRRGQVEIEDVSDAAWQKLSCAADLAAAEKKLNKWLVKPTDGLFAQMNRRVSIPISRQLIHYPITPNMVTLFTLAVSVVAGLSFARGGYWATLLGAVLSVWASILDGCDGEVARLKLQASDFGCWLETVCDYLYYVLVFGGMIVGLTRTMGAHFTLTWGPMLLCGAVASFFVVGFARHYFSPDRPEAFLDIWQRKTETHTMNPLLLLGRHTEFVIRRCFLPYAFLGFALLNILPIAFVAAAIGSNVVWAVALYSCLALSKKHDLQPSSDQVGLA